MLSVRQHILVQRFIFHNVINLLKSLTNLVRIAPEYYYKGSQCIQKLFIIVACCLFVKLKINPGSDKWYIPTGKMLRRAEKRSVPLCNPAQPSFCGMI